MSRVFLRKQFSNYLGEYRAIDDIYVGFISDITPSPTPSMTPTPSITPSITPTLTPTSTLTPTPSITPTLTRTPTLTPTSTLTPTPSITPSSTPAVPYNTGLIVEDNNGGIYTSGVNVVLNGITIPIISTGGTIGIGNCVNIMIRDNSALQYIINYGGGFTGSTYPGQVYNEVRCINFLYNPLLGVYGGYNYTEVLYLNNSIITGNTKTTLIVNPPANLNYGCNIQDLDLYVKFWITGGIVPSPTPTPTSTLTPTPTITPTSTITPTPSITPTSTLTPTPSITPTLTPTNTTTPTPTPTYSFDTDAQNYINAIITSGGTLTFAQRTYINNFYVGMKAYGAYTYLGDFYPMLGGTAATHAINGKSPGTRDLTFFGGWTHNASGATPNGTNAYANTIQDSNIFPNPLGMTGYYVGTQYSSATLQYIFSKIISLSAPVLTYRQQRQGNNGTVLGYGFRNGVDRPNSAAPMTNMLGWQSSMRENGNLITYYAQGALVVSGTSAASTRTASTAYVELARDGTTNYGIGRCQFANIASWSTGTTSPDLITMNNFINQLQIDFGRSAI